MAVLLVIEGIDKQPLVYTVNFLFRIVRSFVLYIHTAVSLSGPMYVPLAESMPVIVYLLC